MNAQTEKRAANIILERGVSVPVEAPLFLKLFGKKTVNLTVKAPSIYTLGRIAERYLSLEIETTVDLTLPESFELLKKHNKAFAEIIAEAILSKRSQKKYVGVLAWWLCGHISASQLCSLFQLIIMYGGIEDFISTIRLTEATRITMPMNLSHEKATS